MPAPSASIDRLLLIGNPAAGLRRRAGLLPELAARLTAAGLRPEVHATSGPGDATRAAFQAAASGRFEAVAALGGDGTVHEVANGLAGTRLPLAVLPSGTMNILARELGVPLDPRRAADGIRDLRPCAVTAGRVAGGRYFLLMAGVGFDAYALAIALRRAGSGKVTLSGYTIAALAAARRYGFAEITASDGTDSWTGSSAILGNVPRYGANLRITPKALLTDDALDLCLLRGSGFRNYLSVFRDVLVAGRHVRRHDVVYRKGARWMITPSAPREGPGVASGTHAPLLQLDGEAAGPLTGPTPIEAVPEALTLLVPPSWPLRRG